MKTPLHEVHLALGATMTEFAGWQMPVRYGSDLQEHHAVRRHAGLFDLSHMGEIAVIGDDAAAAADAAFVSRLASLDVGRARYTMLCASDGGVLDDVIVYRIAADELLVVANAANVDVVNAELTARTQGFNAAVVDQSKQTALIAIQGPAAAGVLERVGVEGLDTLRYYAGQQVRIDGADIWLARTGYTGEDGFELYCTIDDAAAIWHLLADADDELVPAGLACRDTLRLEAGMPLYGHELSVDRTPYAAGLGRIVHVDDRSFVGRDALAAAAGRQPDQVLVGLAADGRRAPRAGNSVVDGDGATVGVVTSGALSPTLGHPIAMAYINVEDATSSELAVDVRGTQLAVRVVDMPFYRRRS